MNEEPNTSTNEQNGGSQNPAATQPTTPTAYDFLNEYRDALNQVFNETSEYATDTHNGEAAYRYWNQTDFPETYGNLPAVEYLGIAPQFSYDENLPQHYSDLKPDALTELASILDMDMAQMLRMSPDSLEQLLKQTEVPPEALNMARAYGRHDGADIANYENEQLAAEAMKTMDSMQQPTADALTSSQSGTKLPDFDQRPEIVGLIQILHDNGKNEQAAALVDLIAHVKAMEDAVKTCTGTIVEMKSQLDTMQEVQNHPIKNSLQSTIKGLENDAKNVKGFCGRVKNDIINGCKNALEAVKDKGIEVLGKLASFFNLREHCEKVETNAQNAINRCEKAITRIETFSTEYHKAGNALKNLGRMLVGKDPVDKTVEIGKLANALCTPFRNSIENNTEIRDNATKAIEAIDRLSERVEAIQEKRTAAKDAKDNKATKEPSFKDVMSDAKTKAEAHNSKNTPAETRDKRKER